ncbi:MAG: copper chaperone PCu(A)C [Sphingomonas sp.]
MRILALLAALLALTGCQAKVIYVSNGYVRLSAVPKHPAVAYFTLHGGAVDATLIDVTTEVAIRAELHESMQQGNMASMKPLDHVALPAASKVVFAPGSKHLMLYDMNPTIVPGRTIPLIFTFADGLRIQYDATVIAAGAPAP